jgi:hypothetical protein
VSRRGSMLGVDIPEGNGREKRVVKEGEVREEREKGVLRAAYASLSCLANILLILQITANCGMLYSVSTPSPTALPGA